MKISIVALLIFAAPSFIFGQTKLAEFTLASKLRKAEAFEVGDSLYVTYTDLLGLDDRKQAAWISNDGVISTFTPALFGRSDLIEVNRKHDKIFFYYVEVDKKTKVIKLKSERFDKSTRQREILPDEILLPGPIVAVFKKGNLHIVCLTPKKGILSALIIDGMSLVKRSEIDFKMTADFLEPSDVEFYNASQMSGANIGSAPAKIIKQGKVLYFSLDGEDRTTIFKVRVPEYDYEKFILNQSSTFNFTTFISRDIIYKVSAEKKVLSLDVYDLNSLEKLTTLKSFYEFLPPYRSYERIGGEHKIEKAKRFDPVIGVGYEPPRWSILVYDGEDVNSIRIGMSSEEGVPIGSIINPVAFFTLGGILQVNEGRGISRYMYFSESKDHSRLNDEENLETPCPAQRADDYEINLRKTVKFNYKGYASVNSKLIGIYGTMNKKVRIVKF